MRIDKVAVIADDQTINMLLKQWVYMGQTLDGQGRIITLPQGRVKMELWGEESDRFAMMLHYAQADYTFTVSQLHIAFDDEGDFFAPDPFEAYKRVSAGLKPNVHIGLDKSKTRGGNGNWMISVGSRKSSYSLVIYQKNKGTRYEIRTNGPGARFAWEHYHSAAGTTLQKMGQLFYAVQDRLLREALIFPMELVHTISLPSGTSVHRRSTPTERVENYLEAIAKLCRRYKLIDSIHLILAVGEELSNEEFVLRTLKTVPDAALPEAPTATDRLEFESIWKRQENYMLELDDMES